MFHSTLAFLTATTMLAHALVGCCAHHSHEAETRSAALVAHECLAEADAVGHEDEHEHSSDDGDRDGHHPPCSEQKCTYLSSSPVKVPGGLHLLPPAILPPACTVRALSFGQMPMRDAHAVSPPASARLQEFLQVWLV